MQKRSRSITTRANSNLSSEYKINVNFWLNTELHQGTTVPILTLAFGRYQKTHEDEAVAPKKEASSTLYYCPECGCSPISRLRSLQAYLALFGFFWFARFGTHTLEDDNGVGPNMPLEYTHEYIRSNLRVARRNAIRFERTVRQASSKGAILVHMAKVCFLF